VLSSRPFLPTTAMKLIFAPTASISPPVAAFRPESGLFPRKTTPPFVAGAALDAPGAEFRPAGASLSRPGAAVCCATVPPCGAGAEFHPPGAAVHGSGSALRQPGAAPIFSTEAPAARRGAPVARNGHPGIQRGLRSRKAKLGDTESGRLLRSAPLMVSGSRGEAALPVCQSPHLQVFCL
jgi:hypothetical protein